MTTKAQKIDNNIFGMILFIASESIFFLLLVLAYVNFHKTTGAQAAQLLDPVKTGYFSIALLSSSATLWMAEQSRKKDNVGGVRLWLFLTVVLGAIFLTGQGIEYTDLLEHNMTISRDLFGSTFFTLTGFHGFHVFFGLCLLATMLGLALWGRKGEPALVGLESVAIYWHFVDAVWIFIFAIVYLWRFV